MLPLGTIAIIVSVIGATLGAAKTGYELTHEVIVNSGGRAAETPRRVIDMTPVETNRSLDGK